MLSIDRMNSLDEHAVAALARRIGLQLVRLGAGADDATWQSQELQAAPSGSGAIWQLVEPGSMTPVMPGGASTGVALGELADWLSFPWE